MLLKKTFFFAWLMSFVCYIYSLTLPYYTNPKAVSDTIAEINPDKNLYYQKVEEFRTIKIALMDFGS